ncbi:hypothetical protein F5B22DRAFT_605718 [Xylaria bambusicola]|nr:uncharacterized protein F5B22DRAFT_605718 [Xylaria bambusicola]KAI0516969.1 hypothetical protein F5B22DRAFT_605718 [Xylaria bambusicola]
MNSQQPNQPPQGQQPGLRLLRPENMRTIQYLNPQERQRYEEGLQTLWARIEQNPPESAEYQQAKQKISEFSRMVMNKIKALHSRGQANAQGQANMVGSQQTSQQAQAQAQVQAQVQAQAQAQAQAQTQAQQTQVPVPVPTVGVTQRPAVPPNRPQPTPNPAAATANLASNNVPITNPGQVPKHIMDHCNKLPWSHFPIPPQIPPEQGQKFLTDTKTKYVKFLWHMDVTRNRVAKVEAAIKDRHEKGIPIAPEELKRLQEQMAQDKKIHAEADAYVKNIRNQFTGAQLAGQANNTQAQSTAQPGRPQPMQPGSSTGVTSTHPMQVPTASINAAMDAARTTQIAAANRDRFGSAAGAQQPQQPQQGQSQAPPSTQPQVQTPITPSTAVPGQPSHAAPVPPPTQVKVEPGTNVQHPPPVNTALATASASHIQSAGTPTQTPTRVQTPQSAQQAAGANVRPLTHAAAVNRANSSTNVTGQPSSASGTMTNTPNMTGMASQPGHSHAHPQPTPTLAAKMPIPKTLPEKAIAPPQPVTLGGGNTPGRPTYGGGNGAGGVINQPVIAKMPIPQFDAEGDHVLSKKKLDELVRQVCGGGSPGADGKYLTPDVEEAVLSVADTFVDDVLHMACRLAKERGSKVLEIRDIQLVLERVYNIRIPGYTSDELRTVRKVQPSPNWIAKMSAIQAAKVTSGKDDK